MDEIIGPLDFLLSNVGSGETVWGNMKHDRIHPYEAEGNKRLK